MSIRALPAGYNFTDLELKLYESIVKDLISVLGGSWENYIDLSFGVRRMETNPTLVQLIGLDETVVIIGINIQFSNCSGQMNFCLPGSMLSAILPGSLRPIRREEGPGEDNSEEILDILRDSELEISAELGRTELRLQDIYYLHPGDVIDLVARLFDLSSYEAAQKLVQDFWDWPGQAACGSCPAQTGASPAESIPAGGSALPAGAV